MKITEIANGIEEILRLKTVELGYLPDIVPFLPSDLAGFETAKQVIRDSGKKIINIVSIGDSESHGRFENNSIIIEYKGQRPAKSGTTKVPVYVEKDATTYNKFETAEDWFDLEFRITYLTDTEEYADIIELILNKTIGSRANLTPYDSQGTAVEGSFDMHFLNKYDISDEDGLERGFIYEIVDVDLIGDELVGEVAKRTEFLPVIDPLTTDEINEISE